MNLASILNLVTPVPGGATAPEAALTPETAPLGKFSALLGLAAMPATATGAATGGKLLPEDGSTLPQPDTGEVLVDPAALLALPNVVPNFPIVTLPQPLERPATSTGDHAAPATQSPQPQTAQPAPVRAPAGLQLQFDIRQILQPIPRQQQPAPQAESAAATPVIAAALAPKDGEPQPAAPAPHAPAPLLMSAPAPVDPARAPEAPAAPATTGARHDFEAVIERLSEARELARPGSATMQLAHREFGSINVQFDMAGQSLKVALASSDAAFAPAVQAALAERPVMASGEAQAGRNEQRPDQPQPAVATSTLAPSAQGEGQRGEQQSRGAQARHPSDQVRSQSQDSGERGDSAAASSRARDGSLFA